MWIAGPPYPANLILTLQQPYFQIRPHSEVLGARTSTDLLGGHNSTHNRPYSVCLKVYWSLYLFSHCSQGLRKGRNPR